MNELKCAACEVLFGIGEHAVMMTCSQPVHVRCRKMFQAKIVSRIHECPVCHGAGAVNDNDKPITEIQRDKDAELADAYNGAMYGGHRYKNVVVGYEPKPCSSCDGWGYWDHAPQPITKTEVVGYK